MQQMQSRPHQFSSQISGSSYSSSNYTQGNYQGNYQGNSPTPAPAEYNIHNNTYNNNNNNNNNLKFRTANTINNDTTTYTTTLNGNQIQKMNHRRSRSANPTFGVDVLNGEDPFSPFDSFNPTPAHQRLVCLYGCIYVCM